MDQQQYPTMYPSAPPTPGSNMEAGLVATGLPVGRRQQLGGAAPADRDRDGWAGNDPNTLIVVATLITALNFLLGLSMPGGYWQTDQPFVSDGGRVVYRRAGDPIMRDLTGRGTGCSGGRAGSGWPAPW
jgi:hypothetical protein